jgi:hypothetical protein
VDTGKGQKREGNLYLLNIFCGLTTNSTGNSVDILSFNSDDNFIIPMLQMTFFRIMQLVNSRRGPTQSLTFSSVLGIKLRASCLLGK